MPEQTLYELYKEYLVLEESLYDLEVKREVLSKEISVEHAKVCGLRDKIKEFTGLTGKATLIAGKVIVMIRGSLHVFDLEEE